jgi:hypothetical protein
MSSSVKFCLRAFTALPLLVLLALVSGSRASADTPPPSNLSYPSPDTFYVGKAFAALKPTLTGSASAFTTNPALPAGLTLNNTTGIISGTPTKFAATSTYTITAANSAGKTSFGLAIAVDQPSVEVLPRSISRLVVTGTSVFVETEIAPVGFTVKGTLYATADDPDHAFDKSVAVTEHDGTYTLGLTTSTLLPAGSYANKVTIELCTNSACSAFQPVKSFNVAYRIDSLTPASAWPGSHLTSLWGWPGIADWSMFQGNAAHTGFVGVTLDPDAFSTRWQQPEPSVPGQNGLLVASTATWDGQLFVSGNDHLYVLKEFDGSVNWSYDFSGLPFPSVNPAGVANKVVYVAAGQQSSTFMFAFDAFSGALIFKTPMSSQWENYLAPTIGANGIYTNAGTYGGLYGFSKSGTQLFFANEEQTSLWTPAVDADGVYSYTGSLQANDPVTGAVTHTIVDPTFQNYTYVIGGSPVIGAPGSIFVANYENSLLNGGGIGNTLLNFRLAKNSIAWKIAGDYPTTPAYARGLLYVANNDPLRLEVRAESDGDLLWSWVPPQAGDVAFISEVLLTENLVFASTNLATYAIDLTTHRTVWSVPIAGKLSLSRYGVLYIQTANQISAFNLK